MEATKAPNQLPRHAPHDPEALIEEARRRARRRRLWYVAAALFAAGGISYGIFGGGGGQHGATGETGHGPGQPATRAQELQAIERAAVKTPIVAAGIMNSGMGWAMNGLGLWLTLDGGKTWRTITPPDVRSAGDTVARIIQIEFADERRGWISATDLPGSVVLRNGSMRHMSIDRTTDGGKTWHSVVPGGCAICGGVHLSFVDARHGFALTGYSPEPRLYTTLDGGARWRLVAKPRFSGAIVFLDRQSGFAVSEPVRASGGTLYRTRDGGVHWQRVVLQTPPRYATSAHMVDWVRFFDAANGVAAARLRDPTTHAQRVLFYVTSDGGQSWSPSPAPAAADVRAYSWGSPGAPPVSAATMRDWMVFVGQRLFVTHDAGRNWSIVHVRYAPPPPRVWDVTFTSPTSGWAIFATAKGPALVQTANGGLDWTPLAPH